MFIRILNSEMELATGCTEPGAVALTAAEAASPILPSGFVRWLLLAVIFVLGGVLFAVIQYAPAAYYQGKWPLAGLAAACAAALLALWRYYFVAKKQFGGITGDLAGWFLQRAELWMLAALAVSQWGGVL